jgi:hypothetical protein
VALVIADVSEEPGASFITVAKNNPEDTILHSPRRENLKSYIGTMLVTASVVPSSPILPTKMQEAIVSSET